MSTNSKHTPLDRLKHHVSGAIERGEKQAIEAVVSRHTPGLKYRNNCESVIVDVPVDDAWPAERCREETMRVRRLLEAAPEMLEALEMALRNMNGDPKEGDVFVIDYLGRVLAKARGES